MDILIGVKDSWLGGVADCFKHWEQKPELKQFRALPLISSWGIWLVRNTGIFEDRFIPPFQCAAQAQAIFSSYPKITPGNFPILL